jgi:hypothetical protein
MEVCNLSAKAFSPGSPWSPLIAAVIKVPWSPTTSQVELNWSGVSPSVMTP